MPRKYGFFMLESLLMAALYLALIAGLLKVFAVQQNYFERVASKGNQYLNLIGFESLFAQWMNSFAHLACLYPLRRQEDKLLLHHQIIWDASPGKLTFYTGALSLQTTAKDVPKQAWMITQRQLKPAQEASNLPFWLFVYRKHTIKWRHDKIYLEDAGVAQLLADGIHGLSISLVDNQIILSSKQPKFSKRYNLCAKFNQDLVLS